jgi:tetratricopeptide (TPR) repeat protein
MLLVTQRFEDAQARADKALALRPESVDAQIVRANALAGLNMVDQAVAGIEEAIRNAPDRTAPYASLGMIQMLRGDRAQAEAAFQKAVGTDPKSVSARLALANFYWTGGKWQEAEAQLKTAHGLDPLDPLLNRAFAYLYMGTGRARDAEPYLKTVAEVVPGADGRLTLADYYISQNRIADARPILEVIQAGDGQAHTTARLRLAAIHVDSGDQASAERLVQEVLTSRPGLPDALVLRAHMLLSNARLDEALTAARAAAKGDSRSAAVQFVLGKVHAARGERSDALGAFSEAARLNPRFAAADLELARIHLATNNLVEAESHARSAVQKLPGSPDAHLLLARASMLRGDIPTAEASVKAVSAALPSSEVAQTEVGLLHLAKRDRPAARAAFERALSFNPAHYEALAALTQMDLEDKRTDGAKLRIDAAIGANPEDVRLLLLSSRVAGAAKDLPAQEQALRRALELDPNNLQAYGMLATSYVGQRRLDDAVAELETMAAKQSSRSSSVAAHTAIAMLFEAQNRPADAQARYEKVLTIDSRAAVAANNLAWLYAERGGNLDLALQLAQTAKSQLPDRPEVDDTLGWIYHKKGLPSLAIASFNRAVTTNPRNPTYHYHLGVAYAAGGDPVKARTSLERALTLNDGFSGAAEARQLLAALR